MIQYENYIIEPSGFGRYDLFKSVVSKKKSTGDEYLSKVNIAWALPIERVIHYLIVELTDAKCIQEKINTLKEYIETYKSIGDDIVKTVKR